MKSTIGFEQQLYYENMIMRYYVCDHDRLQEAFGDFLSVLRDAGYTPAAGFFYSIITSASQVKDMLVQVFLPVNELWKNNLPEDYWFQSYFQVNRLMCTRVVGDRESKFSVAVSSLLNGMIDVGVEPATPPFYMVTKLGGRLYTDIMVGVREEREKEGIDR